VAWLLKSGSPRWYLPTEEGKNQTKKILKGKSVQWLLGKNLRADPRENIPFSLLLLRVGFFLISLHQCYSLRTFAHLKEHS